MDYSSQFQFPGGQPYQNFMTIPPLTPSHSHSAGSDDYNPNSNTSPPVSSLSLSAMRLDEIQMSRQACIPAPQPHQPPASLLP